MPWLQLSITTDTAYAERVEQALLDAGAGSVTYRDAEDHPILEPAPGQNPLWENSIITGLFEHGPGIEQVLLSLASELESVSQQIVTESLPDQDWERAWLDHFKPMQFGEQFWIIPSRMPVVDNNAINMRLDPGLAFGTGTHPTTELCLRWLATHDCSHKTVLDYGCGSGILAIASLLLGAGAATGVDIDPQAIEASHSNASLNRVEQQLQLQLARSFQAAPYDIVLANILSGPLARLAPLLASCAPPGGQLVLSGILAEQADTVSAAYADDFHMDAAVQLDDWVMLHGCRKA